MDEDDSLATRFADLTPVEQDDGPVPVVRIAYSHSFKIVMGYFRRILVNGEHSKRALDLAAGATWCHVRPMPLRSLRYEYHVVCSLAPGGHRGHRP